jgi:lipopolysaccharide transport system ATP-binding protein
MSNIAIKIENLSKQYRLGLVGTGTLSHDLKRWWATSIRGQEDPYLKIGDANDRASKGESDYVWALRDINLEIEQGDVVGIIGKNGAGKSTLLKILSRVTKPSTGSIKYNGRIASLLEVGTGFHPEMTGRENIYMNGSIMGMTRHEITSKLDEIIAFAGVERYIDTPVKRYSSGMTVRLGFSIAAHLEPDILVVDEVLAVGDAEFQKKAIGKMQDVSKGGGRTVLFVSHNMAAVKSLCGKGIVLENGKVAYNGTVIGAVTHYLKGNNIISSMRKFDNQFENEYFKLYEISLNTTNNSNVIDEYDSIHLMTNIEDKTLDSSIHVTYVFKNENSDALFASSHKLLDINLKYGTNKLECILPKGFLNIGTYYLDLYIIKDSKNTVFLEKDILCFEVQVGQREIGAWTGREPGFIKPILEWKV